MVTWLYCDDLWFEHSHSFYDLICPFSFHYFLTTVWFAYSVVLWIGRTGFGWTVILGPVIGVWPSVRAEVKLRATSGLFLVYLGVLVCALFCGAEKKTEPAWFPVDPSPSGGGLDLFVLLFTPMPVCACICIIPAAKEWQQTLKCTPEKNYFRNRFANCCYSSERILITLIFLRNFIRNFHSILPVSFFWDLPHCFVIFFSREAWLSIAPPAWTNSRPRKVPWRRLWSHCPPPKIGVSIGFFCASFINNLSSDPLQHNLFLDLREFACVNPSPRVRAGLCGAFLLFSSYTNGCQHRL